MFDGAPLPNPERMAPPGRLRRGQRSRIGRNALASLLFHALLLIGFIEWSGRERPAEPLPPPALDVELMEAGNERGPTAPELAEMPTLEPPAEAAPPSEPAPPLPPQAAAPPPPPAEAEGPVSPPAPPAPVAEAPAPPPPAPEPLPQQQAEAPRPPAPQPRPVPPPPRPAPPPPSQMPDTPPVPQATVPIPPPVPPPPEPAPPEPPQQQLAEAPPAPPEPAPQRPPQREPQRPQREAVVRPPIPPTPPARPRTSPFPGTLDLSTSSQMPSLATPPPRPPSRQGATSPQGAPRQGEATFEPIVQVSGVRDAASWLNLFRDWLERNKFYPRDAAALGEQGPVRLRIIVEPDGRVRSVDITRPHYSNLLNGGALTLFRGRTLPAFPAGTTEPQATIDLTLNYILIGR